MSGDNWGDEAPVSGGGGSGRFVKPKDWPLNKAGAHAGVVRFLSGRIVFWEGWSGGKPIRASYRGKDVPWQECFPPGIVWDEDTKYGRGLRTPTIQWGAYCYEPIDPATVKFWQIGAVGVQNGIIDLATGPKGSVLNYPIQVTYREKAKPPYSVQGLDKEPVDPVAAKAYADLLAAGGKLEGILTSEGPFPRTGAPAPAPVADGTIPF